MNDADLRITSLLTEIGLLLDTLKNKIGDIGRAGTPEDNHGPAIETLRQRMIDLARTLHP